MVWIRWCEKSNLVRLKLTRTATASKDSPQLRTHRYVQLGLRVQVSSPELGTKSPFKATL
jgi:hypothetical protein